MLNTKRSDSKRRLIIGAPLMLIVVFCFGFFLMHPGGSISHAAASDTTSNKKTPTDVSTPDDQLQNLPTDQPAQTSSASSAVAGASSTDGSNDGATGASSSQPVNKSSTTGTRNGSTQAKSDTSKNTSTTDDQEGLIQTVFNSLLNGR